MKRSVWIIAMTAVVAGVAVGWWMLAPTAQQRAAEHTERAFASLQTGQVEQALTLAREAIELDPDSDEARLIAAQAAARSETSDQAVQWARSVSANDPSLYGAAQLLAAQLCHDQSLDLSSAEQHYRAVLEVDADQIDANQGLARLCGETGRRQDAVPFVVRLIRQSAAGDLLMLVAREDGAVQARDKLTRAAERHPDDPLPPLGLAWLASEQADHVTAIRLLRQSLANAPSLASAEASLGTELADSNQWPALVDWSRGLSPEAERYANAWIARGRLAEQAGQSSAAVRCYLEAALRRPESKQANARLAQLLAPAGEPDQAAIFAAYLQKLQDLTTLQDRIFFATEPSGLEQLVELIDRYRGVGRNWEALAWTQLALQIDPQSPAVRQRAGELTARLRTAPPQLVAPRNAPVGQIAVDRFPILDHDAIEFDETEQATIDPSTFAFEAAGSEIGFEFTYYNGAESGPPRKMYEFSGGGIAVFDYDLDGWPDALMTQGTSWPPGSATETESSPRDQLFRNLGGQRLVSVPNAFVEANRGFGQGATAGDFDGDGFTDLYVGQAGSSNRLYRNNGDGTLSDVTEAAGLDGDRWTTSVVIADLDGDGLSDLYDVNYLRGEDLFQRVCADQEGHPAICMPFDFDAEADVLWRNLGDGRFEDATGRLIVADAAGKGLGVVALDPTGEGRLGLMVANDTTANQLLVPSQDKDEAPRVLRDQGTLAGVAFNQAGKPEGCMGIAVGDIDQNGWSDLVVTNFLYETNSLYLGQGAGQFTDATQATGLADPSRDVLGFGTQFLDANLDGAPELFVANGHIDDLSRNGRPYAMPAQLFTFTGSRFQQIAPETLGSYFQQRWLGRSVARLDWNRDGREDLLVGHLYQPSQLLVNRSPAGHYLAVRLVGVEANRDALGAHVTLISDGRQQYAQLTGGDGYQASNERRMVFGLGDRTQVDAIEVRWPESTQPEQFNVPEIDREMVLVQGQGR